MYIDLHQLPIPDWDVECPVCKYPLKGLPSHRCPECGLQLDMEKIVQTWTRLRPPFFTGRELPVPDFGLHCRHCDAALTGAPTHRCPQCSLPFDLPALAPRDAWFKLDVDWSGNLPLAPLAATLLDEAVPHVLESNDAFSSVYGTSHPGSARIRVRAEYFFDTLWLIARERARLRALIQKGVSRARCKACGASNPPNFELCWKCGCSMIEQQSLPAPAPWARQA